MTAESRKAGELTEFLDTLGIPGPESQPVPGAPFMPEPPESVLPVTAQPEPEPAQPAVGDGTLSEPTQTPDPQEGFVGAPRRKRRLKPGEYWSDRNIRRTLHLPESLLREADDYAAKKDPPMTLSAAAREGLEAWVREQRKAEKTKPPKGGNR